jgi:hypothetical protein
MGNLLLNLDDFVRVTQETGEEIVGRYDGVDYTFPHGRAVDVHKAVAVHIFGFGLPDESANPNVQDKSAALMRLNWIANSTDKKLALMKLRQVRFDEIPPFPTVLRLRQAEENTGLTQIEVPESVNAGALVNAVGKGAVAPGTGSPPDPSRTLGLPKVGKG